MAKQLLLRWTHIKTTEDGMEVWESQLIQVNGKSAVHLDMPVEGKREGNSVNILHSLTGINFVSCQHDYFGEIWDEFIKHPGIGQVIKIRLNHKPLFGVILGDIEDAGHSNPENPEDLQNAFACIGGDYFCGSEASYFLGKNS